MNNQIITLLIIQYIVIGLPLFILIFFHKKINIRNSYKIILGTFLSIINLLSIFGIIIYYNAKKYNNNIIEDFFSNWHYEILVFLIPLLIGIGVLIFYFIRASLGKIDINIFGENFTSGDKLTGEIKLKINKHIKNASLYVYLRGYQNVSTVANPTAKTVRKKKYEDKIILEKDNFFEPNYTKNYNFNFDILSITDPKNDIININNQEDLTDQEKNLLLQMSNFISESNGRNSGKEYLKLWKIEVRLEKKGIDLFNQKVVEVIRKLKD